MGWVRGQGGGLKAARAAGLKGCDQHHLSWRRVSKCAGGAMGTAGAATQRVLNSLKKWLKRHLMMFSKGKHQVLHLGRNNPIHMGRESWWKTGLT